MKTDNAIRETIEVERKAPWQKRLAAGIEEFFTGHKRLIGYIHLAMLIMFTALILIPPFLPAPPEEATPLNNFTVFARFLFWGIWFPLVLLSTVVFGRIWCGVFCPQGALAEYANKVGINKKSPSWLRWEGTPILSFVFVTVLGQLVGVRDYPLPVVEIFGGTMLLAAVVGFIYTKRYRTWCRYLCPIGSLLGIFSRLGMVSFEENRPGSKVTGFKKAACPTFIGLAGKSTGRHCIECFKCADHSNAGAMALAFRKPGTEIENISKSAPSIYEVIFLFGATGLALGAFHWQANPFYILFKQTIGEFLLVVGLGEFIGGSGPWWAMANYPEAGEVFNWLDFISIGSFMLLGLTVATVVLFAFTTATAFLAYGRNTTVRRVTELGYFYAPVAMISIVIGLGQMLFQAMGEMGLPPVAVKGVQTTLFAGGALWSLYLAYKVPGRLGLHLIPSAAGIGLVAWAWKMVIF
ncbi:MAG TPA: ferredoxin [Deltaproteobacteria bacterium]|nr:MAG: hypothetical protein A2Z79_00610 [Deltaproteobacteria bacterium GWA2_55_82]OIJ73948.1 MAG: hypothetical protein A2V21_306515 [Deltaproteobacteria bacterium GWC2_55_46]HBG46544.1 ferredoxin [Deltaproteobacteria bacterium]HCY09946.1 ferredoxin [Deltaproteobacteria bacterium]